MFFFLIRFFFVRLVSFLLLRTIFVLFCVFLPVCFTYVGLGCTLAVVFFFSLLFVNFGVFGFCGCTDEGRVGVRGVGSLRPRDGAPGPDEGLGRDRLPPRRDQGKFAVFLTQMIVLQYTGFLSMTICVRFKRARGVVG